MNGSISAPGRRLLAAVVFAVLSALLLFNSVFHGYPLGVNVPAIVVLFLLCVGIAQGRFLFACPSGWLCCLFSLGFSLAFVFCSDGFLLFCDAVILILLLAAQCWLLASQEKAPFAHSPVGNLCRAVFVRPFHRIGAAFGAVFRRRKPQEEGKASHGPVIFVGVIIALMLVLLIGALLAWGDAIFSDFVDRIFSLAALGDVLGYIVLFILLWMLCASMFFSLAEKKEPAEAPETLPAPARGARDVFPPAAVIVILSALCVLLLTYSALQLTYHLGWRALPAGITSSEYARSGFFQLCVASVLVFTVIALCSSFTHPQRRDARIAVRTLLSLLVIAALPLLGTAFARMVRYEQGFGFTRMRIYVQAFILLLAVAMVLLFLYVWQNRFPIGRTVLFCALTLALALSLAPVDRFIARQNLPLVQKTRSEQGYYDKSDVDYLITLSPDALDLVLRSIPAQELFPAEALKAPEYEWETRDLIHDRARYVLRQARDLEACATDPRSYSPARAALLRTLRGNPVITDTARAYVESYRAQVGSEYDYDGDFFRFID